MAIELCTDEGELKQEVVDLLLSVFKRFDKDKDGSLNLKELNDFAKTLNGEPFDEQSIIDIKESFDVTEEGNLTSRGFIEMYELQTNSEPEETIKDLLTLGIELKQFEIDEHKK